MREITIAEILSHEHSTMTGHSTIVQIDERFNAVGKPHGTQHIAA